MKVRARIELFSGTNTSRTAPLVGNFLPNHSFSPGEFVVGRVEQAKGQSLAPGECADRVVDFLPDGLPTLAEGAAWQIYEGPHRLIGRGIVIELLDG